MASVIDISAVTMSTQMQRVETIAHNIANASTPGFKRQIAATSFDAALRGADGTVAPDALPAAVTHSDLSPGRLAETANPLHLALSGRGYFVVREGDTTMLTRGGAFQRDPDGRLVDARGAVLQGEGGDLSVRTTDVRIETDGTVIEDQRAVGRVLVVDVDQPQALRRGSGGAFVVGDLETRRVEDTTVRQGYLEMANVDLGHEMVQMIEAMRRFELGQRLVLTHEDMMERAIRRLGDLQS